MDKVVVKTESGADGDEAYSGSHSHLETMLTTDKPVVKAEHGGDGDDSSSPGWARAVKVEIEIEPTVLQPMDTQYIHHSCKAEPVESEPPKNITAKGRVVTTSRSRKREDLRFVETPKSTVGQLRGQPATSSLRVVTAPRGPKRLLEDDKLHFGATAKGTVGQLRSRSTTSILERRRQLQEAALSKAGCFSAKGTRQWHTPVPGPSSAPGNPAVAELSSNFDPSPPSNVASSGDTVTPDHDSMLTIPSSVDSVMCVAGRDWKRPKMEARLAAANIDPDDELEEQKRVPESQEARALQMTSQDFQWSQDYSTFKGQKSTFTHTSGPTNLTTDPLQCFLNTWDKDIVKLIVEQTNLCLAQEKARQTSSQTRNFKPTTAGEIYRLLAVFIQQSVCSLRNEKEYWDRENVECDLSPYMSFGRYVALKRALNFVDNDKVTEPSSSGVVARIICQLKKVQPIVDHCRKKFREQYSLEQNIAIDESLMLSKEYLDGLQYYSERIQSAKLFLKTYELCESRTGYLYDFYVNPGGSPPAADGTSPTVAWATAEPSVYAVLHLMEKLHYKNHVLYMIKKSYINSPILARYLKNQGTDFVGTVRPGRKKFQVDVTLADVETTDEGTAIAQHCGDVSVLTWRNETYNVVTISTIHDDSLGVSRKPKVILDYKENMGFVDLKDKHLASFHTERTSKACFYKTFFKHLFNVSMFNMYIIYTESVKAQVTASYPSLPEVDLTALISDCTVSPRKFRCTIAEKLLERFRESELMPNDGEPMATDRSREVLTFKERHSLETIPRSTCDPKFGQQIFKVCVFCSVPKVKRTTTIYRCRACQLPLCPIPCFSKFHKAHNLS